MATEPRESHMHNNETSNKMAMKPKTRLVRGKEHYLVVTQRNKIIQEYEIGGRLSKEAMQEKFPGQRVYLRNKNLQNIPHQGRGSIIWLPLQQAVVIVICAYWGKAYVRQLFPPIKKGHYKVHLSQDGWYLQQQQGQPLVPFDNEARSRGLSSTGHVIPLLDASGNSKCNVEGPDILVMNESVPDDVLRWLQKNPWRRPSMMGLMGSALHNTDQVGVVYVQLLDATVQSHVLRDQQGKPDVCSVPVGCPIYSNSDRCVSVGSI
jgi:hypothetical protein